MATINILDKKVYNRIAAGEVVERPYSVVKELVENALDAGATKIVVDIYAAGKELVQVKDNGCGIEKSELKKAFLPHATSKIKEAEDLENIITLGFRGEAIPSIAAVSNMIIVSKAKGSDKGYCVRAKDGEVSEPEEFACDEGTCVSVESLFFNTPARAKFLKEDKSEEADIQNIMTRLILAKPEIAFTLNLDGQTILQSYGGGLSENAIEIYGYDTVKNCIDFTVEKNGMRISGLIGKADFTKPNRTYQTVILNGRYVINNTIQSAIHNAYAPFLMKRRYPFYVLFIDVDPEFVDVNVHPNKTDVRFVDNQVVYGTVYSVISKRLNDFSEPPVVERNENQKNEEFSFLNKNVVGESEAKEASAYQERAFSSPQKHENDFSDIAGKARSLTLSDVKREKEKGGIGWLDDAKNSAFTLQSAGDDENEKPTEIVDIFAENKKYIEELERKKAIEEETKKAKQESMEVNGGYRIVGQVLTTYIILEKEGDVYLIDQHAAHERLLFNRLMKDFKEGGVAKQTMLIPYDLRVNETESRFLSGKIKILEKMGFEIGISNDGLFKVYSVPYLFEDFDVKEFFDDVLSDLGLKKLDVPETVYDKLAQKACKAAIKSGKNLSESEIESLLKDINYDLSLKCPHGRPISVKITRTEIDKWFKRIV